MSRFGAGRGRGVRLLATDERSEAPSPSRRAPGAWLSLLLAAGFALSGCASRQQSMASAQPWGLATPPPAVEARDAREARALEERLAALDSTVDRDEARRLADCAFAWSRQLAREYGAVRPARFHNMLVNAGLKKRGLCHHWADDLYAQFCALHLRTLAIRLAIARPGTWREHNSVVAGAVGRSFEEGIVLDAWRGSGRLCFGEVKADRYPWEPVLSREEAGLRPTKEAAARGLNSRASSGLPPETASRP